ncbi:hypothetical protein FRX31_002208 [Thalictrum thalictroides]|uniref:Uncharacterized protein n=1 Tax=Thalictrum thalictroides TaxID=46969 RepID=A0A7J6XFA9_THATH|nr:hypothetical protein FRX31_002208 [Thalictrum thalictroides]
MTSSLKFFQLLRQNDIRSIANNYASLLHFCCPHSPTSYTLARRSQYPSSHDYFRFQTTWSYP